MTEPDLVKEAREWLSAGYGGPVQADLITRLADSLEASARPEGGGSDAAPPAPPYPTGSSTNCKRAGWSAFFKGEPRKSPYPVDRPELSRGFEEGWDAAKSYFSSAKPEKLPGFWQESALAPSPEPGGDVREAVAQTLYESDPIYEHGEYGDYAPITPGGDLSWQQFSHRCDEFGDDKLFHSWEDRRKALYTLADQLLALPSISKWRRGYEAEAAHAWEAPDDSPVRPPIGQHDWQLYDGDPIPLCRRCGAVRETDSEDREDEPCDWRLGDPKPDYPVEAEASVNREEKL